MNRESIRKRTLFLIEFLDLPSKDKQIKNLRLFKLFKFNFYSKLDNCIYFLFSVVDKKEE